MCMFVSVCIQYVCLGALYPLCVFLCEQFIFLSPVRLCVSAVCMLCLYATNMCCTIV